MSKKEIDWEKNCVTQLDGIEILAHTFTLKSCVIAVWLVLTLTRLDSKTTSPNTNPKLLTELGKIPKRLGFRYTVSWVGIESEIVFVKSLAIKYWWTVLTPTSAIITLFRLSISRLTEVGLFESLRYVKLNDFRTTVNNPS